MINPKFKKSLMLTLASMIALSPQAHALSSSSPSNPIIPDTNDSTSNNANTGNAGNNGNIIINQGDEIHSYNVGMGGEYGSCTLGYIGNNYAITAGHCGMVGSEIKNSQRKRIGYIDYIDTEQNQDIAIIKLDNGVSGSNIYSGDYITSMAEMSPDDEICVYGKTTRKVLCAEQYGLPRYGAIWSKSEVTYGDSGGAVWIPGKGLIGIISSLGDGYNHSTEAWISVNKYPDFVAPRAESTSNYMPQR